MVIWVRLFKIVISCFNYHELRFWKLLSHHAHREAFLLDFYSRQIGPFLQVSEKSRDSLLLLGLVISSEGELHGKVPTYNSRSVRIFSSEIKKSRKIYKPPREWFFWKFQNHLALFDWQNHRLGFGWHQIGPDRKISPIDRFWCRNRPWCRNPSRNRRTDRRVDRPDETDQRRPLIGSFRTFLWFIIWKKFFRTYQWISLKLLLFEIYR